MSMNQPSSLVSRYRSALAAISTRTGTALPSLVTSFTILHEVTAIAPIVAIFYGARALGIGEKVVDIVQADTSGSEPEPWVKQKCRGWVIEGEQWAGRVGRRYGILGFEKGKATTDTTQDDERAKSIVGDVANVVVAYGATKALLPLRIGLSLYLAPAFSRRIVDPFARTVLKRFKKP